MANNAYEDLPDKGLTQKDYDMHQQTIDKINRKLDESENWFKHKPRRDDPSFKKNHVRSQEFRALAYAVYNSCAGRGLIDFAAIFDKRYAKKAKKYGYEKNLKPWFSKKRDKFEEGNTIVMDETG